MVLTRYLLPYFLFTLTSLCHLGGNTFTVKEMQEGCLKIKLFFFPSQFGVNTQLKIILHFTQFQYQMSHKLVSNSDKMQLDTTSINEDWNLTYYMTDFPLLHFSACTVGGQTKEKLLKLLGHNLTKGLTIVTIAVLLKDLFSQQPFCYEWQVLPMTLRFHFISITQDL